MFGLMNPTSQMDADHKTRNASSRKAAKNSGSDSNNREPGANQFAQNPGDEIDEIEPSASPGATHI